MVVEDRGFRWAVAMLVLLGTVATGLLIGEQASADIAPFYANMAIVPEHQRSGDAEVVLNDEPTRRIETSDLSHSGPASDAFDNASY